MAALVALVMLVDALVVEAEPGSVRQRVLRRRPVVASIALSAGATRFDSLSPTFAPAFLGVALVVLLLDLRSWRAIARADSRLPPLAVLSDLGAVAVATAAVLVR